MIKVELNSSCVGYIVLMKQASSLINKQFLIRTDFQSLEILFQIRCAIFFLVLLGNLYFLAYMVRNSDH